MFKNKIFKASQPEVEVILKNVNSDIHVVEIDGRKIQSWQDYISEIETKMKFPTTCIDSIDRYLDWITDLTWLEKKGYILIIYNFTEFIKNDLSLKSELIEDFKRTILPFWQEEIKEVVVNGEPQRFNVYLVD